MAAKYDATEPKSQAEPSHKGCAPLIRIAQIRVTPDQVEKYRNASRRIVDASVAQESGILAFYALQRRDAPGSFFVVEIYRDQQAYEAHLETERFRNYKAEVAGIVQSLELIDLDVVAVATKPFNPDSI